VAGGTIDNLRLSDWRLHFESRDMRFSNTPDCWVINHPRGQRLNWVNVLAMPYEVRNEQWPKKEGEDFTDEPHLRIAFQRNPNRYPIISGLVAFDADKFYRKYPTAGFVDQWKHFFETSWGPSRPWYEAYVTYTVQGPPNLDPSQHPVMTWAKMLFEIRKLKNEASSGPNSEYNRMVASQPMGPQILDEWEKRALQELAAHPWTPEKMEIMGFDPVTKYPYPNPAFLVDRSKAIFLDVPDKMLEVPRWHHQWHSHLVLARPDDPLFAELKALPQSGKSLLLRGEATHMYRLAARAVCVPLPKSFDASEAKQYAESDYATISRKLGPKPFLLTFQQLAPVHQERYADENIQHVAISSLDWAGSVDARAGSLPEPLKPLSGYIVRDVGQEFKPGPIRIRRLQAGQETGDEYRGVLAFAARITVEDLNAFNDEEAWRFGKLTAADLYSQWKKVFANLNARDPQQQKLWRLDLADSVDRDSYRCIKRDEMPVAQFLPNRPAPIHFPNSPEPLGLKEVA
jgi:hypothetical protein